MESQKNWLKFIISGRVDDYLKFVNSCRKHNIREDNTNAFYDRRPSYKGDEGRRE